MSAIHPGYTIEDLEGLRLCSDLRFELVDGVVLVTPSPEPAHNLLAGEIYAQVRTWLMAQGAGRIIFSQVDVQLDERTVVGPDLTVLLNDRLEQIRTNRIVGAPSLVVEVISKSSRRGDSVDKRGKYARAAVPEYWMVDPELQVVVRHSKPVSGSYDDVRVFSRDDVMESATIPGLGVQLTAVFNEFETS